MPPDRNQWANAYAKQSQSDYRVFELLQSTRAIDQCHRLHYLQMACEKIAKAYRFRDTSTSIESLLTSHVAFSKFIETILASADVKRRYSGQDAMRRQIARIAQSIARDVEKLAPAVDREASPQNAEYPWRIEDKIAIPCDYNYPVNQRLQSRNGQRFLHLIRTLIFDFDHIRM